jgi:5-methylcytosine-specific restriction endonuclease McrA
MTGLRFPKPRPHILDKRQQATERATNWRKVQTLVRIRDKARCVVCGKPGWEVHHVVYRSHGGKDEPRNLALLCKVCHEDAHAKLIALVSSKRGWRAMKGTAA